MDGSAGSIFGIDEDCFVVGGVGVLGDGSQLDVVLLAGDLWVHEEIEFVMGQIVVPAV